MQSKNKNKKENPILEITLRRYERPYDLAPRSLVKRMILSIGLLQPGDSRDIIVDIMYVLLEAQKTKTLLSSKEIEEKAIKLRKKENLPLKGIASSNIRRQVKRLRDILLVEKIKTKYRISEFAKISEIFSEKIEQYMIPIITNRIKEYFKIVEDKI